VSENILTIDIGGTSTRMVVFGSNEMIDKSRRKYDTPQTLKKFLEVFFDQCSELIKDYSPVQIVIGGPGPLNSKTGVFYKPPNMPHLEGLCIVTLIKEKFGLPARLFNDANLAALGESSFGKEINSGDLIYFTLSTGVGSGVISHGRLIEGSKGLASELGHMKVPGVGLICGCGRLDHLECYASGTAIRNRAGNLATSTEEVFRKAAEGDDACRQIIKDAGEALGYVISQALLALNSELIIFGGSVGLHHSNILMQYALPVITEETPSEFLNENLWKLATLGDDSGLWGAYATTQMKQNNG
jgi:glucokinase